jgi:hypothetical protein
MTDNWLNILLVCLLVNLAITPLTSNPKKYHARDFFVTLIFGAAWVILNWQ